MSPAEITQQLGLQSLTRRAWVSLIPLVFLREHLDPRVYTTLVANSSVLPSSSNLPAPPPVTVCTRVWSGSPILSGKPTATKRV